MGKEARKGLESQRDDGGLDPVLTAYRRTVKAARAIDLHMKSGDTRLAARAIKAMAVSARDFVQVRPLTRRGRALKVVASLKTLREAGDNEAARMVRRFFLTRKTIDGLWLHDLRKLSTAVEIAASQPALTVACLNSILESLTGPRKV